MRSRRGITPVVAIVLLLMMTVAASGGAYAWMTQVQEEAQEEAGRELSRSLDVKDATCTRYGNVDLAIKNGGSAAVAATTADVFVYDAGGDLVSQRTDVDISGAAWRSPGGFGRTNATIGTNFSYSFHSNREKPHTVAVYAPWNDATVSYYIDETQDAGTANQTVQVPQGGIRTFTLDWEGDHRFYSTEPVIAAKEASRDRIYIPEAHHEILHTFSETRLASDSGTTIADHNPFYNATGPFSSTQIADGSGTDAELGLPTSMLSSRYVVPHEVDDYAVAAIEPATITVKEWTGSGFTTYDTHDFTDASPSNPRQAEVDDQSGADGVLNITAPVVFEGTGEFYLRTNDQSADEYSVIDYGPGGEQAAIALFSGTVDYATVEDGTSIRVNGSTVAAEPTPATGSFSVGRGDRITFDGPVGLQMSIGYPVPPVTTARRILPENQRHRVELSAGDVSVEATCLPRAAE